MIDPFVLLTPVLLLGVVALLRFVGCDQVYKLERPDSGGITEVGLGSQRGTAPFSGESGTLAFPGNVAASDLLIVAGASWQSAAGGGPPTSISVTDTLGTPYTVVSDAFTNADGSGQRLWIAYGIAPSSGACAVTVNPAGTSADSSFSIDSFSGVDPGMPRDVDGFSARGTTMTPQGSLTTNTPDALLIGVMTHDGATLAITPGPDYTQIGKSENNAGSQCHSALFRLVTAAETYNVDWTLGAVQPWMVYTAAFRQRP